MNTRTNKSILSTIQVIVGEGGTPLNFDLYVDDSISGSSVSGDPISVSPYVRRRVISATDYTLQASDNGYTLEFTATTSITVHIPTGLNSVQRVDSSSNPIANEFLDYNVEILQSGSGQITFSPDTSVTVNNRLNYTKTAGQYAPAFIRGRGTNTYLTGGDMA